MPANTPAGVCKHGRLARSCEVCDLERELAQTRKVADELALVVENEVIKYDVFPAKEELEKKFEKLCRKALADYNNLPKPAA